MRKVKRLITCGDTDAVPLSTVECVPLLEDWQFSILYTPPASKQECGVVTISTPIDLADYKKGYADLTSNSFFNVTKRDLVRLVEKLQECIKSYDSDKKSKK